MAEMTVDEFMARIARVESGDPNAVNADSGAHGMFQIMPANWPSWSREAGLGTNAPKTAANQVKVARFKMQQYKAAYGTWEAVAAAWYGGGKAAGKWVKNPNDGYLTRKQGKYPSIADYVSRVMGKAGTKGARKAKNMASGALGVSPGDGEMAMPEPTEVAGPDPDMEREMERRGTLQYQMASFASLVGPFQEGW